MAKQEYKKFPPKKLELDYAGKIPPYSEELEDTVLGQLMLEDEAITKVYEILNPETFFSNKNQKIYTVIQQLSTKSEPINILTVVEELRKCEQLDEIGGAFHIAQLTQKVSSAAHLEHHCKLLSQKYIQRELIRVSAQIQEKAFDQSIDVADLIDFSEKEIFKVAEGNIKKAAAPISVVLEKAIENIKLAQLNKNKYSGEPSGFSELDAITSGWQKSNMIVIAARPAMGKTAFILSMLRNMAVEYKLPVAMFSLEMSNEQLVNRLIVGETEIEHLKFKSGQLSEQDWKLLYEKTKILSEAPIYIDDTPALDIFEFRAKCRRLVDKHQVKCVFVDYLQLMTTRSPASREQEVSLISRQIKAVAMELEIPIIALSQLNRSVETRTGNKRPQLSDLRESGAIEQDADLVMFIHRPEYYGLDAYEDGESTKGIAEIIIAKNRHGAIDDVKLEFIKEFTKFVERNMIAHLSDINIDENSNFDNAGFETFSSKMNQNNKPEPTSVFDTTVERNAPF